MNRFSVTLNLTLIIQLLWNSVFYLGKKTLLKPNEASLYKHFFSGN